MKMIIKVKAQKMTQKPKKSNRLKYKRRNKNFKGSQAKILMKIK